MLTAMGTADGMKRGTTKSMRFTVSHVGCLAKHRVLAVRNEVVPLLEIHSLFIVARCIVALQMFCALDPRTTNGPATCSFSQDQWFRLPRVTDSK